MTRRAFLAAASAPAAGAALPAGFHHRGYLGWITDLASRPDPRAEWPSMRLDEDLLRDYHRTFALMKQWGLQNLCVWGLYVARAWPLDISSAVPAGRGRMVERLLDDAHAQGVRVVSGLGLYSWGFDVILKHRPHLSKGNRNAMCGSEDESWEWMRKVIDFVFTRFPIDGVSMQSADQGRCACQTCRKLSDTEYHAGLNTRCAAYIRGRWPGKLVAVNGWGMRFDQADSLPALIALSRHIDYLIDVTDSSRRWDPSLRRKLTASLHCAFGTLGGPQVEPPQHWPRDAWFLPTIRRAGDHLEELYGDGGRACEWFYHILANPGCEISTWVAAGVLRDPQVGWRKHLASGIEQIYRVRRPALADALGEAFVAAEDAYLRHLPAGLCGTISLEPLVSSEPGPPVYLIQRLSAAQRAAYSGELLDVRARFEKLIPEIPEKARLRLILRCIDNVRKALAG